MPPVLTRNGDSLELALSSCRGGEFMEAKDKIKEIPGRRFDFDTKMWVVPADPAVAERVIKTIRPEVSEEILAWVRDSKTSREEALTTPLPEDGRLLVPWATKRMPWQPEFVNEEPYNGLLDYQRAAVAVMAEEGRAILADDMGLGKTFEAISAVEEWKLRNGQPEGPSLVVAPNSVKGGWARELTRWLEDAPVQIVDAASPATRSKQIEQAIADDCWTIINWEQLRVKKVKKPTRNGGRKMVTEMKEPQFEHTEWLGVIADEIHRAKNRKSQQTQGLWRVRGKVMYGLSGTPLMNSPDELWSLLRWLWPEQYNSNGTAANPKVAYWAFYEDFVDYWEDPYGKKVITGVKNPDALRFALKGKLIRRTASILGLKGRKRIFYNVPMGKKQRKLYDEAEKALWLEVEQAIKAGDAEAAKFAAAAAAGAPLAELVRIANGASRVLRLQQIIESPAVLGGEDDSALLDDAVQKFEDSRPEPWVFFTKFKETNYLLAERLRRLGATVEVYNGDVSPQDRTDIEDRFQKGEVDAIIGTIEALKEGITLTRSRLEYFVTRSWVPDINEQCEAREDRLGQQQQVLVYIPQAENSVAVDKVEPTNRLKEGIVRTVLPKDNIEEDRTHA